MSERATPWVVVILQKMAQQIEQHALDSPELWKVTPQTVAVGLRASLQGAARPLVAVACEGVTDLLDQVAGGDIDAEAQVAVVCAMREPDEPERAMHDLAADVRRAVMSDPQLGGMLENGYVEPAGYEGGVDLDDAKGESALVVRFKVFFVWNRSLP